MDVRAGREASRADQSDQLPGRHQISRHRAKRGEVAVEDPCVVVEHDLDVVARTVGVVARDHSTRGRGVDRRPKWRRQVDAGMDVVGRAVTVEGFEQPNGWVTLAPRTTAETGSRRWLGTWVAATSISTTPLAIITSGRITPSPAHGRS